MKLRAFYWWERYSIDGLRQADFSRWPFPPKAFDVYWVGGR